MSKLFCTECNERLYPLRRHGVTGPKCVSPCRHCLNAMHTEGWHEGWDACKESIEEDKRHQLIKPEGAAWGPDQSSGTRQILWAGEKYGLVASAYLDGDWWADSTKGKTVKTLDRAKQAAEETLAAAQKYGFHWEGEEP